MSWRMVVITKHSKLSYKNNFLIVQSEDVNMIHLTEINTLLIETSMANISTGLLCELIKKKIKVIFCDEKHNPISEVIPYYGSHNTSKKVGMQISWDDYYKKSIWTHIIKQKIMNQAYLLQKLGFDTGEKLYEYAEELEFFDMTNREGHAAKVYFNSLFGKGFSRDNVCSVNAALDYGYSIILSNFNKEIVSNGYLTQIGIKHINEYNHFNLSSDFMEPFRVIIDKIVYENIDREFDRDYRYDLVDILNLRVELEGKEYFLSNAIQMYVKKIFQSIEEKTFQELILFQYP